METSLENKFGLELNLSKGNEMPSCSRRMEKEEVNSGSDLECKPKRRKNLPKKGTIEYISIRREDAKVRRKKRAAAHKCPHCDYTAVFPNKIRSHMDAKHSEGRFNCEICRRLFNTINEKRKHIKESHRMVHICETCGFEAARPHDLKKHVEKVHINGMKCTVPGCNIKLIKRQMKRHLVEYHSNGKIESISTAKTNACLQRCGHCSYTTYNYNELEEHVEKAHVSGIKCPFVDCDELFLLADMDAHFKKVHTEDSPDLTNEIILKKEKITDEAATTVNNNEESDEEDNASHVALNEKLEIEEEINSEREQPAEMLIKQEPIENSFYCQECGRSFSQRSNLKKHINSVHSKANKKEAPRPKKHHCSFGECTKSFTTIGLLEDHLNAHRDIKPFTCDHCQQSFHARSRFAVHLTKYHQTSIRKYEAIQKNFLSR